MGVNVKSGYPKIFILFIHDVEITTKMNALEYVKNFPISLDSHLNTTVILLDLKTLTSLKQARILLRLMVVLLITPNNNKPRSSCLSQDNLISFFNSSVKE